MESKESRFSTPTAAVSLLATETTKKVLIEAVLPIFSSPTVLADELVARLVFSVVAAISILPAFLGCCLGAPPTARIGAGQPSIPRNSFRNGQRHNLK